MKLYEKIETGIYVIAEMSANHGGKIDNAYRIIEEAKEAGADCIKIQTYTADTLTIPCDKQWFQLKDGIWAGYSLYDLYQEAYTPWGWQENLKKRCEELDIDFLSTPFDRTSVDFLEGIGIEFYKIASPELVDIPLIRYIASKGKPMIISCGMGNIKEIEEVLNVCHEQKNEQVILLKCCSQYPAQYKDMNLKVIPDMQQRFGVPIGLSDHSIGSVVPITAMALGAKVIEKHVRLDEEISSADEKFSMKMSEFKQMVQDLRNAKLAMGNVTYELTENEKHGLQIRRSLFAVKDIKKGEIFTEDNIRSIRPGYGIAPKFYETLLGKIAKHEYQYGDPLSPEEVEDGMY